MNHSADNMKIRIRQTITVDLKVEHPSMDIDDFEPEAAPRTSQKMGLTR